VRGSPRPYLRGGGGGGVVPRLATTS